MYTRMHCRFKGALINGTPAIVIGQACCMNNCAGFLRWYKINDGTFVFITYFSMNGALFDIDKVDASAFAATYPLNHTGVKFLPALHKQRLFRKFILGIKD